MTTRSIIPVLPTIMTLGNLICGFMAMAKTVDAMTASTGLGPLDSAFETKILQAAGLVLLGMVFDALDGRVARLTNATSPFGAQVDSLADAVTFGVAPALMAKVVYEHGKIGLEQPFMPKVISALCALYVIGAVLRLARFTVKTEEDESDHHTFEGLPSPAAAGVIVSAIIFIFDGRKELWLSPDAADAMAVMILRSLPIVAALTGVLMVSRVPYVHVVQRYVGHRTGVSHFVNVVVIVAIVLVFHEWSLFLASSIYVLGGLALSLRSRITGRPVLESLPEPFQVEEERPATTMAVVALGSNLSPRQDTLRSALRDLGRLPGTRLVRASRWRETEPVDAPENSPNFMNGACLLETSRTARELLDDLHAIETRHGRMRSQRNAPRSLDLDLVLYGDRIIDEPGLIVPHPRAHERLFVLQPAAEVGPDLRHPLFDVTLAELYEQLNERTPN